MDSPWKKDTIKDGSTVSSPTPDPNAGFQGTKGAKKTTDPNALMLENLGESGRKSLAKALRDAGYKSVPLSGKYSDQLFQAYIDAFTKAATRSQQFGRDVSVAEYLVQQAGALAEGKAAQGGTTVTPQRTISDRTQAASIINPIVKDLLGRDATPKELASLTKVLNDAENKNPYVTVNGKTTGGIDKTQFLTDLIKTGQYIDPKTGKAAVVDKTIASAVKSISKLAPEISVRAKESEGLQGQKIKDVALANGVNLTDRQVQDYINGLKSGKDIATIYNDIRTIGSFGMPDSIKQMVASGTDLDTIYSPYRNRMAAILDLNPQTISLNDATLRSAIGPDKEMSLYEFDKALRKDSRWKYSEQAHNEVRDMVDQVKRDFGFMG